MKLKTCTFKSEMPATRHRPTAHHTIDTTKDTDVTLELANDVVLVGGLRRYDAIVVPLANVAWFQPAEEEAPKKKGRKKKAAAAPVPVPETAMADEEPSGNVVANPEEPPAITEL